MGFDLAGLVLPLPFVVVVCFVPFVVIVCFELTSGLVAGLVVAGGLLLAGFVVFVVGFVVVGFVVGFVVESFPVPGGFVVPPVMSSISDFGGASSLRTMEGGDELSGEAKELVGGNVPRGMVVEGLHRLQFFEEGIVGGSLRVASRELTVNEMLKINDVISTPLHAME